MIETVEQKLQNMLAYNAHVEAQGCILSEELVREAIAEIGKLRERLAVKCEVPGVKQCERLWAADGARTQLESVSAELAEEFPFGCDTAGHLARALVAVRAERQQTETDAIAVRMERDLLRKRMETLKKIIVEADTTVAENWGIDAENARLQAHAKIEELQDTNARSFRIIGNLKQESLLAARDAAEWKKEALNAIAEIEQLQAIVDRLYRAVWELPEHEEIEAMLDETICEIHECNRLAAQTEVPCRCAELAASRPDPGLQAQAGLHLKGCPVRADNARLREELDEARLEQWRKG